MTLILIVASLSSSRKHPHHLRFLLFRILLLGLEVFLNNTLRSIFFAKIYFNPDHFFDVGGAEFSEVLFGAISHLVGFDEF